MKKLKILVVDSDDSARLVLVARLQQMGYEVYEAKGGKQAIELLDEQTFDLVFSELDMPEVNGFAVLKKVKSLSPPLFFCLTPGRLINTLDFAQIIVDGANQILSKPIGEIELKRTIRMRELGIY